MVTTSNINSEAAVAREGQPYTDFSPANVALPFFSYPELHRRWGLPRQETLLELRSRCTPHSYPAYRDSFFRFGTDERVDPVEQSLEGLEDEGVRIGGYLFYPPPHTIFQAVTRVLSKEATEQFRGLPYGTCILEDITARHVDFHRNLSRHRTSLCLLAVHHQGWARVDRGDPIRQLLCWI
jgi:hypothetical protein